ncbi:glycoside hydrolase family 18 protein [Medicago truncatula]|uniref:Glycoside hydrolase family 18 protein n=1 Tax=Medicago truncatula TaxID=3880 RepID=G7IG16_MEDTR|nr:glycoside hydrolase family 18 protein [Medicago truncatula]
MGIATNSLHGLVAFIFYVLIGFLQICYPDNPTVFQLHPKTILSRPLGPAVLDGIKFDIEGESNQHWGDLILPGS